MRRPAPLQATSLLLAFALPPATASCQPRANPAASVPAANAGGADATSPDLGDALRQFYVHVLAEELGLPADRAQVTAPKVRALLDAQRLAMRDVVASGLAVRRAAEGIGDPAAAIAAFEEQEREGRERTAAARQLVLDDLTPRQDARFLAFEGRFRERVRALIAGGAEAAAAPRPIAPQDEPEEDAPARASLRETRVLMFVHEVRTELALDDAHALALVDPIEALVGARLDSERERRRLLAQLRARAWDDAATDKELAGLVKQSLAADRTAADAATAARKKLLSAFSPKDAARFLVLEQRFFGRARQAGQGGRRAPGMQRPGGQGGVRRPAGQRALPPGERR